LINYHEQKMKDDVDYNNETTKMLNLYLQVRGNHHHKAPGCHACHYTYLRHCLRKFFLRF